MADTIESFVAKLGQIKNAVDGPGAKRLAEVVGKGAVQDFDDALVGDLGDRSMSGWPRKKPFELSAEQKYTGDNTVEVRPKGRAAGPVRVLESGREAGSAYDLILVGRVRKKTGTRRGKTRGRNQGATSAAKIKHTWSDAERLMEAHTPARVQREYDVLVRRVFGG